MGAVLATQAPYSAKSTQEARLNPRAMWLPKFFYESIPFYLLGLGVGGLGVAFYLDSWYWAEIAAGGGLFALVVGLMLLLRRKGYRSSRSRVDFDRSS